MMKKASPIQLKMTWKAHEICHAYQREELTLGPYLEERYQVFGAFI